MWKFSFQDQGVHKIAKKPNHVECFFQFLMLNISSTKELLHKPLEIKWNITGTLSGKLKRKTYWALSCKILPPEITKMWEIPIFGGVFGAWETMWNLMVFLWFHEFLEVSVSIFWLEIISTLNLFWIYFRGYHQKKILRLDHHSARCYWCKKDQKNIE